VNFSSAFSNAIAKAVAELVQRTRQSAFQLTVGAEGSHDLASGSAQVIAATTAA
jgi:hypothetical protein